MKLLTYKLPSKGFGSSIDIVDLQPLTYRELTLYSSKAEDLSSLAEFIWDFENLIMTIPNWEGISMYDVEAIISIRKFISVTNESSVELSDGSEFSLDDVDFSYINDEIKKIKTVEIMGMKYTPSIKSAKELYGYLKRADADGATDIRIAIVAAYLGLAIPRLLEGVTHEDISLCEFIYSGVIAHPFVKNKEGEEVVLVGSAPKLFQYSLKFCRIDSSKIQTS